MGVSFNPFRFIKNIVYLFRKPKATEINVYFIPGMCYNCKVFDQLKLPAGFVKKYIEWHIPQPNETLSQYAHVMAKKIDSSHPFILVGYSFGAVIMQEMNRFLHPRKSIVISSFKAVEEIPLLFQTVKKIHLVERVPKKLFSQTDFITEAFNRFVYHAKNEDLAAYMTQTDSVYIRWAVKQITNWTPDIKCKHLFHIHGTADQIFPYDRLQNVFPVEGGDHLMVLKKANTVSAILASILLMKTNDGNLLS